MTGNDLIGRKLYQLKKLGLKGMSFDATAAREKLCIGLMYSMVCINLTITQPKLMPHI